LLNFLNGLPSLRGYLHNFVGGKAIALLLKKTAGAELLGIASELASGDKNNKPERPHTVGSRIMTTMTVEKDLRLCMAVCPTHGVQCKLRMFEQEAFPKHAHFTDGKMCVWSK